MADVSWQATRTTGVLETLVLVLAVETEQRVRAALPVSEILVQYPDFIFSNTLIIPH